MENLNNIAVEISTIMWADMVSTDTEKANKTFSVLLAAYNDWQENEHFGTDYLFNLNKAEDLICCIKGGLNATEIAQMVNNASKTTNFMSDYFLFGENYPTPTQLTCEQMASTITTHIIDIIKYVLHFGCEDNTEEFKFIYNNYIAPNFTL